MGQPSIRTTQHGRGHSESLSSAERIYLGGNLALFPISQVNVSKLLHYLLTCKMEIKTPKCRTFVMLRDSAEMMYMKYLMLLPGT